MAKAEGMFLIQFKKNLVVKKCLKTIFTSSDRKTVTSFLRCQHDQYYSIETAVRWSVSRHQRFKHTHRSAQPGSCGQSISGFGVDASCRSWRNREEDGAAGSDRPEHLHYDGWGTVGIGNSEPAGISEASDRRAVAKWCNSAMRWAIMRSLTSWSWRKSSTTCTGRKSINGNATSIWLCIKVRWIKIMMD